MTQANPRKEAAESIETIPEPQIRVTKENLDHALRILREVLDEEKTQ